MGNKGALRNQTDYDDERQLLEYYKQAFLKKEMSYFETVTALRIIGYGYTRAEEQVKTWQYCSSYEESIAQSLLRIQRAEILERKIVKKRMR